MTIVLFVPTMIENKQSCNFSSKDSIRLLFGTLSSDTDAKPLEYFHTLFHHHALPSVTTLLYHDSDFGDSKLI